VPDGSSLYCHVINPILPEGERRNKTPFFISEVSDCRAFQAWLLSSYPLPPPTDYPALGRKVGYPNNSKWVVGHIQCPTIT
jgi:hypothetical protein